MLDLRLKIKVIVKAKAKANSKAWKIINKTMEKIKKAKLKVINHSVED